jgi:hypothetical protein
MFRLQPDGFTNRDLRAAIAQLRGEAPFTGAGMDPAAYVKSAYDGVLGLLRVLDQENALCADKGQQIVLGGYSQGSWVIHAALTYYAAGHENSLSALHLAGVLLLADPQKLPNPAETQQGTASRNTYRDVSALNLVLDLSTGWPPHRCPPSRPSRCRRPSCRHGGSRSPRQAQFFSTVIPADIVPFTLTLCNVHGLACGLGEGLPNKDVHKYENMTVLEGIGRWLAERLVSIGLPEF